MSLDKALKNIKFDKRLTEIHILRGQLTREEFEKHLKDLPDLSSNTETVSFSAAIENDDSDNLGQQH